MEDLLMEKDIWYIIFEKKPDNTSNKDWKKLNRKSRSMIRLCIADSMLINISIEKTAKALWDKLGALYQSKYLDNKLFLSKKLYNIQMYEGDLVTYHINSFNTIVSQLQSIKVKIKEEINALHCYALYQIHGII